MTADEQMRLECARIAGGAPEMAKRIYEFVTEQKAKPPKKAKPKPLELSHP